ncbi:MAG: formate/nitrite transporter family protein [Eubacteriales bacterium]
MRKGIFEGMAAGMLIGIGGAVFCACENKVVGAVLFTVALLSICLMGLQLFTGKVGFLVASHTKADLVSLAGCLIGNALGTLLCAITVYFGRNPLSVRAAELVAAKLQLTFPEVFLSAVLCGILMYTAVYCYKVKNTPAAIFFCVPVFILSGFEHSIADMFYFFAALSFTPASFVFLLTVVLGNSVGGMLIPALVHLGEE